MALDTVPAVALGSPAGDGVWSMIVSADPVVQGVLVLLLLASIWCWAVILDRGLRLVRINRKASRFEQDFWSVPNLQDLYRRLVQRPDHPMALMFVNAMAEWQEAPKSADPEAQRNLLERIGRVARLTLERELEALERGIPSLATIGSTAPFVGLFGTVWGIMNSFQSIAQSQDTSLAVVAPGIAEALFATAMGLLAAIPAVVAYNRLSRMVEAYAARLEAMADELVVVLGREFDLARAA